MLHPVIQRFEAQAELLDLQENRLSLDDALVRLASWMGLVEGKLTEDDIAALVEVGGILYREGLRKRQS